MVLSICFAFLFIGFLFIYLGFEDSLNEELWWGLGTIIIIFTLAFGFGEACNNVQINTQEVKIDYALTENAIFYEFEGIKKVTDYQTIINLKSGSYDFYRIDSINSYGLVISHKHKVTTKLKEPTVELENK